MLGSCCSFDDLVERFGSEANAYEFCKDAFSEISFRDYGILILTETDKDQALWSYYTENKGFCLEFDVENFPFRAYGPFPINYVEELKQIDTSRSGRHVAALVQTNEKKDCWRHEKEWRMLVCAPEGLEMQTFEENGILSRRYNFKDEHDRKFRYPLSALKSVILGQKFFSDACVRTVNDYEIAVCFCQRTRAARVIEFLSEVQAKNPACPAVRYAKHKTGGHLDYLTVSIVKTYEMRYRIVEIKLPAKDD